MVDAVRVPLLVAAATGEPEGDANGSLDQIPNPNVWRVVCNRLSGCPVHRLGAIAGFLPPTAPSADAAQIAALYHSDYTRIRIGMRSEERRVGKECLE